MNALAKIMLMVAIVAAILFGTLKCSLEMAEHQEQDWKQMCEKLGAEFDDSPQWVCIRDNEVVYP